MNTQRLIQKSIAALLLVVFAFSITPKRFLHDCVAAHKDRKAVYTQNTSNSDLTAAGFNCQCDNLVVESPFVPSDNIVSSIFANTVQVFTVSPYKFTFSALHLSSTLRGPPVFA